MVTITVEIISDIVCVWCYIASRTLQRAISLYRTTYPNGKRDTFRITWRPYYLNRDLFAPSIPKSEAKKTKLAGWTPEKIAAAENRIQQAAGAVGIKFASGGMIGRTGEAHSLIGFVQDRKMGEQLRDRLVEGIFRGYHERERDISDVRVLREIAVEAGLGEVVVEEWEGRLEEEGLKVDEEAEKNRGVVTAGVPFFIIGGVHIVDGAQDVGEFLEAFVKVREASDGERQNV